MDPDAAAGGRAPFEEQIADDARSGRLQPLRHYIELWPDDQAAVADRWLRAQGPGSAQEGSYATALTVMVERGREDASHDESTQPSSRPTMLEAPPQESGQKQDGDTIERLGPYLILREVGRGGQGVVYLAEDNRLQRKVALKVLRHFSPDGEEVPRRFHREAAVAARLEHPGICVVHEMGIHDGKPFIAMQFVEGEALSGKVARAQSGQAHPYTQATRANRAPPRDVKVRTAGTIAVREEIMAVVSLVEDAARALQVAHDAGIIHRDIKPANIMVRPDGRPVLLDFGLAREQESESGSLTHSDDLFGTPSYMSPEQLTKGACYVDGRTDIWSLGVTLFEALACRRPFQAPTREGLYQSILQRDPPDIRKLNPAVPKDLRVVVETALEKQRDGRYQSALDLAEDLRRVRELEPIRAKPVGPFRKLQRWAQRNPAVANSLAAAFLFLITGLVASLMLLKNANEQRRQKEEALVAKSRALVDKSIALSERTAALAAESAALQAKSEAYREKSGALKEKSEALREKSEALKEKSAALEAKTLALARMERALNQYRQMSDVAKAEDLRGRESELWPRRRATVPAMKTWLAEARHILGRLPAHREALEEIRARALAVESLPADEHQPARKRYRFSDQEDTWRHQVLTGLVAELGTFGPLIAEVEKRLAFSLEVERISLSDSVAAWKTCIADIAGSARYGKVMIKPQLGLVPLGRDSASGLWEFWHVGSGKRPEWVGKPTDGKVRVDAGSGIVLVLVPGGTFAMGAQGSDPRGAGFDPRAREDEQPVRQFELAPFFIGKYELTQAQWLRLFGKNPSHYGPKSDFTDPAQPLMHPVERISWNDCVELARRLDLELPTEAQWEYAARGGESTPWWTGSTRETLRGAVNLADRTAARRGARWSTLKDWPDLNDGFPVHAPVNSLRANPFGLHHVHGNVWEWCQDRSADYRNAARAGDGLRTSADLNRIVRGGSFDHTASDARAARRDRLSPKFRNFNLGFRPARRLR